jgi:hypothetical protein
MNRKLSVLLAGVVAALILPTLGIAAPDRTHPKLAYDPNVNRVLVVYESLTDIYGQLRNTDGTPLGLEIMISNGAGTQQDVAVAFDTANRRFLAVWRDGRNSLTTGEDIYGQFLNADGFPSGGNFVISNAPGNQVAPSVVFDTINQRFLVAWEDGRNAGTTGEDIYGQLVNADGSLFGTVSDVNFAISQALNDQLAPSVAYDTINQTFLVAWRDGRNALTTGEDIYGQFIHADGSLSEEYVVISEATGDQTTPSVAYDTINQRFLVVWQDGRNSLTTGEDIYGQLFNPNGSLSGENVIISDAAGNQLVPSVAYDIVNQRFLVAWEDGRNLLTTGQDIYGQLIHADGSPYQTASNVNFVISDAVNDQDLPSPTFNSNCANYLVAFQTEETGPSEGGFAPVGPPCRDTYNTITLLNPNGGETIPSGAAYPIHWGAPAEPMSFKIEYSINNGISWKLIAEGVTGTGYVWQVPDPQGNRENTLVRVIGYNLFYKKVGRDRSNSRFKIEVIRITSPSVGEEVTSGDLFSITWDTYVTNRPVARVEVFYTNNGGLSWSRIALIKGSNPGLFSWRIPIVRQTRTRCRIKVILKDAAGRRLAPDISQGYFTINPLP